MGKTNKTKLKCNCGGLGFVSNMLLKLRLCFKNGYQRAWHLTVAIFSHQHFVTIPVFSSRCTRSPAVALFVQVTVIQILSNNFQPISSRLDQDFKCWDHCEILHALRELYRRGITVTSCSRSHTHSNLWKRQPSSFWHYCLTNSVSDRIYELMSSSSSCHKSVLSFVLLMNSTASLVLWLCHSACWADLCKIFFQLFCAEK